MNVSQDNRIVRMADVAAAAGVSKVTASKVLSGDTAKSTRVSESTRQRIVAIAEKLGYRRNITARILAGKQSKAIGVILDADSPPSHFYRVSLMEEEARRLGFRLMIGQCRADLDNIKTLVDDFMSRGIDGIISMAHVYPHIGREVIAFLRRRSVKTVFCDMPFDDIEEEYSVITDIAGGTAMAVDYLYRTGRRRIMLFLPQQNLAYGRFQFVIDREDGYRRQIAELGLPEMIYPADPAMASPKPDCAKVFAMLDDALKQFGPDGIVAQNDVAAGMVIRYCHLHGIELPRQMAVIGYDNLEFSRFTFPSITTEDPVAEYVARKAVEMVVDLINGSAVMPQKLVVEPKLIIREST